MIRSRNLHETLKNALGVELTSAVLVTTAGGLLAAAHVDAEHLRSKDHHLMIAAVVNIWRNYSHNNLTSPTLSDPPHPENLEFVIVQFETRRLCMVAVGPHAVLSLESSQKVEVGLLKLKATTLHAFLEPQLKPILSLIESTTPTGAIV